MISHHAFSETGASTSLASPPLDALGRAYADGFPSLPGLQAQFAGALRQALDHPGSLARARLAAGLMIGWGVGQDEAVALGTAIEYWHTASLLLDDLPCMDDATERRGAACAHLRFGESSAILAALALINRGYSLAWSVVHAEPSASLREQASACIEQCLGATGILNGQALDLAIRETPATVEDILEVADGKTGTLFRLAMELPAILAGRCGDLSLQPLGDLGKAWGRVYQILDDFKDCVATDRPTGKTSGRYLALGRPSLVVRAGLQGALAHLHRELARGREALDRFSRGAAPHPVLLEWQNRFETQSAELLAGISSRSRV
jgi:geranylgeranyl diphosphate synthase type II